MASKTITFGVYTDIHLSENIPCHRIDNSVQTQAEKLVAAYNLFVQNGCQFVLFGGDFYDRHMIFSYKVINHAIKVMTEAGIPTYACIGEHDLYGHSVKTYENSSLSFMAGFCPNFQILWEPKTLDCGITLYAKHEWQKMEEVSKIEVDPKRFNLLLCHELLHVKKMPFDIICTKDLDLPFDLVCSGDLHCGFPAHKVGKTWYANPGSLFRRTTADAKRMPKVLLVDVNIGYEPRIREIVLPGFKAGSKVLSVGISETVKGFESEIDISHFKTGIEAIKARPQEKTDIWELYKSFREINQVPDDVHSYLLELKERLHK